MEEKIYTIPIMDGFNSESTCPFCFMEEKLHKDSLDYILGPAYMEDDIREKTDKLGFCKVHLDELYKEQNRLGLALMEYTHLVKINKILGELFNNINFNEKKGLFKKNSNLKEIQEFLKTTESSCYVCEKIESTLERYIYSFFYLLKKDKEFKEVFLNSKGFCFSHFSRLIEDCGKYLKSAELEDFIKELYNIQSKHFQKLEKDLDWFIKKFDYRYEKEPWYDSKEALSRTINMFNSKNGLE
ncbi:MAG: DUF6062 family protein [Lachnospirales bacterium]